MGSNVFKSLLNEKIESFVNNFSSNTKELFADDNGKIIHNQEYGKYREELVKELIRNVIPGRLDIGEGFIITSTGKISTQCDLIIYDKNNCPLIENYNRQRFFPIECVVAIGEVKSELSKSRLKYALIKLKNNKLLRNEISFDNAYIFYDGEMTSFNPTKDVRDQLITFLICNKINSVDFNKLVNEMDELYDNSDDYYLRHNMILSIMDGTLMYRGHTGKRKFSYYPFLNDEKMINSFLPPTKVDCNDYKHISTEHIIGFLNYLYMGVSMTSIMYPEMTNYLGGIKLRKSIDENNN